MAVNVHESMADGSEIEGTAAGDIRKGTMRAIVQDGYGSADVLRLAEIDGPRSRRTRCWSGWAPPGSTAGRGTS